MAAQKNGWPSTSPPATVWGTPSDRAVTRAARQSRAPYRARGSMFMVPPGNGATSGPSGPAREAAAPAVPSPARTTRRSGFDARASSMAPSIRAASSSTISKSQANPAIRSRASSAAPGPTPPDIGLTRTVMRRSGACGVSPRGSCSGSGCAGTSGAAWLMPPERSGLAVVPGAEPGRSLLGRGLGLSLGRLDGGLGLDSGRLGGGFALAHQGLGLAPAGRDPAVDHGAGFGDRPFLDAQSDHQRAEQRQHEHQQA